MSYCSNCGAESYFKVCTKCGVKQGKVRQFCTNCGGQIHPQASICGNCGAYTKKPGILKFLNIPRFILGIVFVFSGLVGLIASGNFAGQNAIPHILSCGAMLLVGLALLIVPFVILKKADGITKGVATTNIILILVLSIAGIVLFGVISSVQDKLNAEKDAILEQQQLEAAKAQADEIIGNVVALFGEQKYAEIVELYNENIIFIASNENFAGVKDYFEYAKVMDSMDAQSHDYFSVENVIETLEGITPGFADRDNLLSQLQAELQTLNGIYYSDYIYYIVDNGRVAYTSASSVSDINPATIDYTYIIGKGNRDAHYCFYNAYAEMLEDGNCYVDNEDIKLGAFLMDDNSLLIAVHEYCSEVNADTLRNFNGDYALVSKDIPANLRAPVQE